jgi:hypothetical protein
MTVYDRMQKNSPMNQRFIERSAEEAKTQELLDTTRMDSIGIEWSTARQLVAMVYRACWTAALTVEQVNKRAEALGDLVSTPDLQEMLTTMTRKKILRSRRSSKGRKIYEVNY